MLRNLNDFLLNFRVKRKRQKVLREIELVGTWSDLLRKLIFASNDWTRDQKKNQNPDELLIHWLLILYSPRYSIVSQKALLLQLLQRCLVELTVSMTWIIKNSSPSLPIFWRFLIPAQQESILALQNLYTCTS